MASVASATTGASAIIENGVIIKRRDKFQPEEPKSAAPKAAKAKKAAAPKKAAAEAKVQEAHKDAPAEKGPEKARRARKARTAQPQEWQEGCCR